MEDAWRRKKWAATFDDYKAYIEGMDAYTLENAARITGVPVEKIERATELIAKPNDDGTPRKTLSPSRRAPPGASTTRRSAPSATWRS